MRPGQLLTPRAHSGPWSSSSKDGVPARGHMQCGGPLSASACRQRGRPCRSNLNPGKSLDREEHSCGPQLPTVTRGPGIPPPSLCSCCGCTKTQPLGCDMEGGCTRPPPDAGDLNRVQSHSGTSSQRCPVRTSQSSNSPHDSCTQSGAVTVK